MCGPPTPTGLQQHHYADPISLFLLTLSLLHIDACYQFFVHSHTLIFLNNDIKHCIYFLLGMCQCLIHDKVKEQYIYYLTGNRMDKMHHCAVLHTSFSRDFLGGRKLIRTILLGKCVAKLNACTRDFIIWQGQVFFSLKKFHSTCTLHEAISCSLLTSFRYLVS